MLSRLAEVALTAVKAFDLDGNDILVDMVVTDAARWTAAPAFKLEVG